MLAIFLKAFGTIFAALPGAVAVVYGLIQAAEKTNFQKTHPEHFKKLSNFNNDLIWLLVEYWIAHIIWSATLALIWTLLVAEPKAASKRQFEGKRGNRRKG